MSQTNSEPEFIRAKTLSIFKGYHILDITLLYFNGALTLFFLFLKLNLSENFQEFLVPSILVIPNESETAKSSFIGAVTFDL